MVRLLRVDHPIQLRSLDTNTNTSEPQTNARAVTLAHHVPRQTASLVGSQPRQDRAFQSFIELCVSRVMIQRQPPPPAVKLRENNGAGGNTAPLP
jgi:hypothetical protein